MKAGTAQKISNAILSCAAGFASFLFSLGALLYVTELDLKVVAAIAAGGFVILITEPDKAKSLVIEYLTYKSFR